MKVMLSTKKGKNKKVMPEFYISDHYYVGAADFYHIIPAQFDVFALGHEFIIHESAVGAVQVLDKIAILNFLDNGMLAGREIVVDLDGIALIPAYGDRADDGQQFALERKLQGIELFIILKPFADFAVRNDGLVHSLNPLSLN